jgi:hypothetical protein
MIRNIDLYPAIRLPPSYGSRLAYLPNRANQAFGNSRMLKPRETTMKTIDTINIVLTSGQNELNSALTCNQKARSAIQSSMNRILGDIAMTYTDRDASLALFGNAIAEVLAVRGFNSADYELVANKSLRSRIEAAVKNVYGFKGAATLVYQAPKKSKNGVKSPSIPCQHTMQFPDCEAPFRIGVAVAVATVKDNRDDDTHDDSIGDAQ